jgi:hypothetical protein
MTIIVHQRLRAHWFARNPEARGAIGPQTYIDANDACGIDKHRRQA